MFENILSNLEQENELKMSRNFKYDTSLKL